MNKLGVYTLTALFLSLGTAQKNHAATIAPPLEEQVEQVSQWFTGFFNNSSQVAENPEIPLIAMTNCAVEIVDDDLADTIQSVYLQQEIRGNPFRVSYYEFSPGDSAVDLSVRSFVDSGSFIGLCDRPSSERAISFDNLQPTSCDLDLIWQPEPTRYIGSNAPEGCPGTVVDRVISDVVIEPNRILSLDVGLTADNVQVFGTPIEFQRISVPEPAFIFGLFALGIGATLRRNK